MADRLGAEIGRREMPALDHGARIVRPQRLDRFKARSDRR
jgi:hypothetical protein